MAATPPSVDLGGGGARQTGKGLRHFSMKVCEKVESKGRTTYNEVADELVIEFSQPDAEATAGGSTTRKNIRRRVYDAPERAEWPWTSSARRRRTFPGRGCPCQLAARWPPSASRSRSWSRRLPNSMATSRLAMLPLSVF
eukprot:jgi/Botrbrau1/14434/Bobra.0014s0080.1